MVDVKLKDVFTDYQKELEVSRITRLNELPVPHGYRIKPCGNLA
jgi:hypothetical protein